jgi:hypothetical protein
MLRIRYVACLLLLFASSVLATGAEPIRVEEGGYADVSVPVPDGGSVLWRFTLPPVKRSDDLQDGRLIASWKPGTLVTATAITIIVDFDKRKTRIVERDFVFLFAGAPGTPPVVPPGPVEPPPVTPPPIPAKVLYFAVVGADGPVNPAVTKSLLLPEWTTLTKSGHTVKYFSQSEAAKLGIGGGGEPYPFVAILRNRADKKSDQLKTVPLPVTGVGVLALPGLVQ